MEGKDVRSKVKNASIRFHAGGTERAPQWLSPSDICHMCSVQTCSHLWTGQGVNPDLPILMFSGVWQACSLVHSLPFACVWQKPFSSACSQFPPVACLSPATAGKSEEVTHLQSFSVLLNIIAMSTAAVLLFSIPDGSNRFPNGFCLLLSHLISASICRERWQSCASVWETRKWPKTFS